MSRISTGNTYSSALNSTELNASKIFELQRQLSTGKKIDRASDDPDIASKSQRIESKIRRDEQTIRSIDNFGRAIIESETYMGSSIEQLQRVRTLALNAANETLVTADLAIIGAEINEQLENILRTANSRSAGRSIFAGAETDEDAFVAVRNGAGEITSVTYQGDDVELAIDVNGNTPLSWPGSRVFSSGKTVLESTATTWNGSSSANYADRELAAAFLPSSGVLEGVLRINGVQIGYDLDGSPTTAEGDSLRDIATKINEASAGVRAEVTGVLQGNNTVALPIAALSTLAGFTAGSITLNNQTVNVTGTDTLFTFADRINALTGATGVTAEIYDAAGIKMDGTPALSGATSPLSFRLSGGVEISDNGSGDSSIMRVLGVTTSPAAAAGHNLVGTVIDPYAIKLTGDRPGPFTIEDASGSLAADLGFSSAAAVTEGGSVFTTLIELRDRLRLGDSSSVRTESIPEIDLALQSVEIYRAEAGIRTERLESRRDRLESVLLNQRKALSDISDVDLSEVIVNLRTQQAAQTASLRAMSDILNLSLLNFL